METKFLKYITMKASRIGRLAYTGLIAGVFLGILFTTAEDAWLAWVGAFVAAVGAHVGMWILTYKEYKKYLEYNKPKGGGRS